MSHMISGSYNPITEKVVPKDAVVLDLNEFQGAAELLTRIANRHLFSGSKDEALIDYLADQIEQQTKPPKPEEPTGLGAVVEDSRGVRWVRTESAKGMKNPWQATLHPAEGDAVRSLSYCDIDAVRVLNEGVRP